jgi:DNA-binding XRE family transcriptional regulator
MDTNTTNTSSRPRLLEIRRRCGWTYTARLAVELGVSEGTIHRWESGRGRPRLDMAGRIVGLLNRSRPADMPELSIEDLFPDLGADQ